MEATRNHRNRKSSWHKDSQTYYLCLSLFYAWLPLKTSQHQIPHAWWPNFLFSFCIHVGFATHRICTRIGWLIFRKSSLLFCMGFFLFSNGLSQHCGLRLSSWALVMSEGLWSWPFFFFFFGLFPFFFFFAICQCWGNYSKREPASHFHHALFPVPANWSAHCSSERAHLLQLFVAVVTDSCHRDRKHELHFWHTQTLQSLFAWNW